MSFINADLSPQERAARKAQRARKQAHNRPRSGREVLPSLLGPLASGLCNGLAVVFNLFYLIGGGPSIASALILLVANIALLLYAPFCYKARIIRRREVRESNLDRVDDWIIAGKLPAPSPQLAKILAEEERSLKAFQREEAIRMAAKGLRPDGQKLPDPDSNRSRKKQARRAARAELERLHDLHSRGHDSHCDDPAGPCTCWQ